MKKLFFAICFIVFSAVLINPSNAAIKQMRDEIALQQYNADKSMQIKPAVQNRNIPTSFEAFRDFIRERAQKVEKIAHPVRLDHERYGRRRVHRQPKTGKIHL